MKLKKLIMHLWHEAWNTCNDYPECDNVISKMNVHCRTDVWIMIYIYFLRGIFSSLSSIDAPTFIK